MSYRSAGRNRFTRREIWTGVALSGAAVVSAGAAMVGAVPAASAQVPEAPAVAARVTGTHTSVTSLASWMPRRRSAAAVTMPGAEWYRVAGPAPAPQVPDRAALQATIVQAATSQVGRSDPAAYGGTPGEWCAAFASWVYRSAGLPVGVLNAAYQVGEWAQSGSGTLLAPTATPQQGDAVLFESNGSGKAWPGPGLDMSNIAHVNIVASVQADGSFTTIGGNENGPNGVSAVRAHGPYSAASAPSWWGQTVYGFVRPGRS